MLGSCKNWVRIDYIDIAKGFAILFISRIGAYSSA